MPDGSDLHSPKIACWDTRSTEKLKVLPSGMGNLFVGKAKIVQEMVCNTVWYGMAWHGMTWCGMLFWYGMLCYGMLWYSMIWYGMI